MSVWLTEVERQILDKMVSDDAIKSRSDLVRDAILELAKEKGYIKK